MPRVVIVKRRACLIRLASASPLAGPHASVSTGYRPVALGKEKGQGVSSRTSDTRRFPGCFPPAAPQPPDDCGTTPSG
jgi:hypothetical protein